MYAVGVMVGFSFLDFFVDMSEINLDQKLH